MDLTHSSKELLEIPLAGFSLISQEVAVLFQPVLCTLCFFQLLKYRSLFYFTFRVTPVNEIKIMLAEQPKVAEILN